MQHPPAITSPEGVEPADLHTTAVLVGKALRQRLDYGLDMHPEHGYLRMDPEQDDQPDDGEAPYWLQGVIVNDAYDKDLPAAVITDAYGRQFEVRVQPVSKISDPNGILVETFINGWKKEGANEERRQIDWLLGEVLTFVRGVEEEFVGAVRNKAAGVADRIARQIEERRFVPNPYDPFDRPAPRPED